MKDRREGLEKDISFNKIGNTNVKKWEGIKNIEKFPLIDLK